VVLNHSWQTLQITISYHNAHAISIWDHHLPEWYVTQISHSSLHRCHNSRTNSIPKMIIIFPSIFIAIWWNMQLILLRWQLHRIHTTNTIYSPLIKILKQFPRWWSSYRSVLSLCSNKNSLTHNFYVNDFSKLTKCDSAKTE